MIIGRGQGLAAPTATQNFMLYCMVQPAPVTPGDFFAVTPSPGQQQGKLAARPRPRPTPPPDEELKFALLNDAKTQK